MSKQFLTIVIALLVLFGGFMTWLHYAEIELIDSMLRCAVRGTWA